MNNTVTTTCKILLVSYALAISGLVLADAESKDTFETCLDELKGAVKSSPLEGVASEYDPKTSLEESIRIYDECLRREGITLSIKASTGEGGGSRAPNGNAQENTATDDSYNSSENGARVQKDTTTSASSANPNAVSSELETSVHEFDKMLSQIQQEIDAERAAQLTQSNGAVQQVAQASETTGQEPRNSEPGAPTTPTAETVRDPLAAVSNEGKHDRAKREPLDPQDEDIILKTIREAAEVEQDPSTQQALWDQYYEYAGKNK